VLGSSFTLKSVDCGCAPEPFIIFITSFIIIVTILYQKLFTVSDLCVTQTTEHNVRCVCLITKTRLSLSLSLSLFSVCVLSKLRPFRFRVSLTTGGPEVDEMDDTCDPKDFHLAATFRFFSDVLCNLFEQRHFRPLPSTDSNETNEHRYVKHFVRDFCDIHGRRLQNEIKFAAIPMGERILVCHCKVKGRNVTIRAKTECCSDPIKLVQVKSLFVKNMIDRVDGMCGITLDDLPNDVKLYIIKNLDLSSLLNLAKSNHYWYTLIKENNWLWKIIYKRDFGNSKLCIYY
jgi:hypothetical protein